MSRTGPVACTRCGQTWPRHPALEVRCPSCGARAGAWCKRPSEHQAADIHSGRFYQEVGANIRERRYRAQRTQKDLARELGVSQATYCRWESGEIEVPAFVACNLGALEWAEPPF